MIAQTIETIKWCMPKIINHPKLGVYAGYNCNFSKCVMFRKNGVTKKYTIIEMLSKL